MDVPLRENALKYLLLHFSKQYSSFDSKDFADVAFVPARAGDEVQLAKPFEVTCWLLPSTAKANPGVTGFHER
jgi:hypothetical protein